MNHLFKNYSLKNSLLKLADLNTPALSLIIILFAVFTFPCAEAQNVSFATQSNPSNGFAIDIPSILSRNQINEVGAVVLSAQATTGSLPRLIITKHPGVYAPRSESQHNDQILKDYWNVGYTDAKLIGTFGGRFKYMPKDRHSVQVSYTNRGEKFLADVTYVSTNNNHFIITYTDTPNGFSIRSTLRERILSSFRINRNLISNTVKSRRGNYSSPQLAIQKNVDPYSSLSSERSDKPLVVAGLLLVVALIVGAATIFRQDSKGGSGGGAKKTGNG
jgi:hypothetical protein